MNEGVLFRLRYSIPATQRDLEVSALRIRDVEVDARESSVVWGKHEASHEREAWGLIRRGGEVVEALVTLLRVFRVSACDTCRRRDDFIDRHPPACVLPVTIR